MRTGVPSGGELTTPPARIAPRGPARWRRDSARPDRPTRVAPARRAPRGPRRPSPRPRRWGGTTAPGRRRRERDRTWIPRERELSRRLPPLEAADTECVDVPRGGCGIAG